MAGNPPVWEWQSTSKTRALTVDGTEEREKGERGERGGLSELIPAKSEAVSWARGDKPAREMYEPGKQRLTPDQRVGINVWDSHRQPATLYMSPTNTPPTMTNLLMYVYMRRSAVCATANSMAKNPILDLYACMKQVG